MVDRMASLNKREAEEIIHLCVILSNPDKIVIKANEFGYATIVIHQSMRNTSYSMHPEHENASNQTKEDMRTAIFVSCGDGHVEVLPSPLQQGRNINKKDEHTVEIENGKGLQFLLYQSAQKVQLNPVIVAKTEKTKQHPFSAARSFTPHLVSLDKRGMWAVQYPMIPSYLHSGALYQSLDNSDDSMIHIPFDCFRVQDFATNLCEFSILLRTMQFWILNTFPDGVIEYCYRHDFREWNRVALDVLGAESFAYRDLCAIFCGASKNALFRAIRMNSVEIVEYLASGCCEERTYKASITIAARLGKLESLQVLHKLGVPWDKKTCAAAASGGHLECLKYAHENGCEWDQCALINAALHDHLECLKYAFDQQCPRPLELTGYVAKGGNLQCLLYLVQNGWRHVNQFTCAMGVNGSVAVLQYLHENGCMWNEYTTDAATRAGKLATLRYAVEHGCPVSLDAVTHAAAYGRLVCLQYLTFREGIPDTEIAAAFAAAMLTGNHECFAFLFQAGYEIDSFSFLSEPLSKQQKRCAVKKDFDDKFCACLKHALAYGVRIDNHVAKFISSLGLTKCREFCARHIGSSTV